MHAKNRNRKTEKIKTHLNLEQLNKAHSNLKMHKELIITTIGYNDPDMLVRGEAYLANEEENLEPVILILHLKLRSWVIIN